MPVGIWQRCGMGDPPSDSFLTSGGGPVGPRGRVGCGGGGGGVRKVMEQGWVRVVGRGRGGRCGRRSRRCVAPGKVKVTRRGELVVVAVAVVAMGADAAVAVAVGEGGGVPVVDDGVHGHGDLKCPLPPSADGHREQDSDSRVVE